MILINSIILNNKIFFNLKFIIFNKIRENACICLSGISFNDLGKSKIIEEGCVLKICEHLTDNVEHVRVAVTLTLASINLKLKV